MDVDNLTVDDIRTREQNIAYGINLNNISTQLIQILKGNRYSSSFEKNVHNEDTLFTLALRKGM